MFCILFSLDSDVQLTGLIKMLISPEPIVANITTNDVANADGSTTTTTVVSLSVCVFIL